MVLFLFKKFLAIVKKYVLGGMSFINQHLFILDGHGSHVTLEATKQTQEFGLDISTIPSHRSHVL
jgi:hypothetical protein